MKYQNTSIVRPPDVDDELFSVLHLLTGEAAPLRGVPGGGDRETITGSF